MIKKDNLTAYISIWSSSTPTGSLYKFCPTIFFAPLVLATIWWPFRLSHGSHYADVDVDRHRTIRTESSILCLIPDYIYNTQANILRKIYIHFHSTVKMLLLCQHSSPNRIFPITCHLHLFKWQVIDQRVCLGLF